MRKLLLVNTERTCVRKCTTWLGVKPRLWFLARSSKFSFFTTKRNQLLNLTSCGYIWIFIFIIYAFSWWTRISVKGMGSPISIQWTVQVLVRVWLTQILSVASSVSDHVNQRVTIPHLNCSLGALRDNSCLAVSVKRIPQNHRWNKQVNNSEITKS